MQPGCTNTVVLSPLFLVSSLEPGIFVLASELSCELGRVSSFLGCTFNAFYLELVLSSLL